MLAISLIKKDEEIFLKRDSFEMNEWRYYGGINRMTNGKHNIPMLRVLCWWMNYLYIERIISYYVNRREILPKFSPTKGIV